MEVPEPGGIRTWGHPDLGVSVTEVVEVWPGSIMHILLSVITCLATLICLAVLPVVLLTLPPYVLRLHWYQPQLPLLPPWHHYLSLALRTEDLFAIELPPTTSSCLLVWSVVCSKPGEHRHSLCFSLGLQSLF